MGNEIIQTRTTRVWLKEDGIIYLLPRPDPLSGMTLDDVKEFLAAIRKLGKGKKMPIMNDLRGYPGFSADVDTRAYIAGDAGRSIFKSVAFLVDSPVSRMVGNFVLYVNKPSYPTRLFTNETEAVDWLKGFHNEEC